MHDGLHPSLSPMATLTVKVSWGKEKYDIALDAAGDVLSFKAQLQSLTGVSAERQKISEWRSWAGFGEDLTDPRLQPVLPSAMTVCKAWKGTLKDDAVFSSMPDLKDGIAMTLMGSADTVAKPAAPVVFVEDLPKGAAAAAGKGIPVGLENTGNTVRVPLCFIYGTCCAQVYYFVSSRSATSIPRWKRSASFPS